MKKSNFITYMEVALLEANEAFRLEEVPVGCVITKRETGEILSRAHNLMQTNQNPTHHAELLAINNACAKTGSKSLAGCDIYVTLEPCTMCAAAIAYARVDRLYYGASDTRGGAVENGVRFFTSPTCFFVPEIYSGIGEDKSLALMKSFFRQIRKDKL